MSVCLLLGMQHRNSVEKAAGSLACDAHPLMWEPFLRDAANRNKCLREAEHDVDKAAAEVDGKERLRHKLGL